jgi:hypothetical protein
LHLVGHVHILHGGSTPLGHSRSEVARPDMSKPPVVAQIHSSLIAHLAKPALPATSPNLSVASGQSKIVSWTLIDTEFGFT